MKTLRNRLLFACLLWCNIQGIHAQTQIALPAQTTTFTSWVRGYYFTAPVSFNICELYIPTDATASGPQNIAVVRFTGGAPPAYPGTTNAFVVLFQTQNNPSAVPIPCNIPINAGDVIGVYGARTNNCINSYGTPTPVTTILGNPVTLYRSGMQYCLSGTPMQQIWSEIAFQICRVFMYINCCQPPTLGSITGPTAVCPNNTYNYSIPAPFPGTITYNWTVPAGATVTTGQGTNSVSVTMGNSTGQVCVTATDSCGASTPVCINITQLPPPTSTFTLDTAICINANANAVYTGNATPAATYTWNFAGGNVVSGSNQGPYVLNWGAGGLYNVTLSVTENGCTSLTTAHTIDVHPLPSSSFTIQDSVCWGVNGVATYTGNASPNATFIWNFSGNMQSGSGAGPYTLTFPAPGVYTQTLTVVDFTCVSPTTQHTIVVNPIPTDSFSFNDTICVGGSTFYQYTGSATGAGAFHWNFAGGSPPFANVMNNQVTYNTAGTYLTTMNVVENGCSSFIDSQYIHVFSPPTVDFTPTVEQACDSLVVNFVNTSASPASYNWVFGDPASGASNTSVLPNPFHKYYNGVYSVSLTVTLPQNQGGCVDSLTRYSMVTVIPTPVADFTASPNIDVLTQLKDANYLFTNASSNGSSYQWFFGDGDSASSFNAAHAYMDSGHYQVTLLVFNQFGCFDQVVKGPYIVIPNNDYFIPNCFTPNGDKVNDEFRIYGANITEAYYAVYDRWGNLLFETHDMNEGWNGTYHNKPVSTGVYMYVASITFLNGKTYKVKGDVTVLN